MEGVAEFGIVHGFGLWHGVDGVGIGEVVAVGFAGGGG